MNEAIRLALTMVGGGMIAILVLMAVAKFTSMVKIEERQGRTPIYNIEAVVKGKRILVEEDTDHDNMPRTTYYVTFQRRDGNRVEMVVPGEDYGLTAEGDEGILVFEANDKFVVFKRM